MVGQRILSNTSTVWYTYIIKSQKKRWYYVGSTNRLDERLLEHNSGKVNSTKPYRPFSMIYTKEFQTENEARMYERRLKDKRMEKEDIIRKFESVQ
ncbi:MAG: GIY-YIG nuclease family protein [bacterium]|nr:GIY-YIG nuclease family protein [bacterium]